MSKKASATITVPMTVDVDGAPNAYGRKNSEALDFEANAHVDADPKKKIVGYRTKGDDGRTPVIQGPNDPRPGFFVSETSYSDDKNKNADDPRRYVNAAEINYTLHAKVARDAGVKLGDFCVVHSLRTKRTVFAIVGDSGHSSGAEGSLALLQRLGYPFTDGKNDSVEKKEIIVRYFAGTNPNRRFFFTQAELDVAAQALDLDTDFSKEHPGDPGTLVLDAVGHTEGSTEAPRVQPFAPLPGPLAANVPAYPGHLIRRDDADKKAVKLIQQRLRDLGFTERDKNGKPVPLSVDGGFGSDTVDAVELFQVRHTDLDGNPLEVDGIVGATTWGALFGREAVPASTPPPVIGSKTTKLAGRVLEIAASQIGVLEKPIGSNAGPEVNEYLKSVGLGGGNFWCMAFVHWCYREAATSLTLKNPAIKTAGVLDAWNRARDASIPTLTREDALHDPSKITPGMVFIISTGGGSGHTGIVVGVKGNVLETIEGNTNDSGSRNGIGVFRRTGRTVSSINRGYIDYCNA